MPTWHHAPVLAPPAANDEWTALVVEPEPAHARDLRRALHGLGCAVLGPAASGAEALTLLRTRRPDLAFLDARLADDGRPLAAALDAAGVPFAVLATGGRAGGRPLLVRPYGPAELRRSVAELRRADLERRLVAAEERIAAGRARLARQARLLRRFLAAGHDAELARGLLRELARAVRSMRAHRAHLRRELAAAAASEPGRGGFGS